MDDGFIIIFNKSVLFTIRYGLKGAQKLVIN